MYQSIIYQSLSTEQLLMFLADNTVLLITTTTATPSWLDAQPLQLNHCSILRTLSPVLDLSSVVIGSGAHMAMVAMVNNASGICKAFVKEFINCISVVETNATLHTLEPCSSHVETLRSV